MKKVVLVAVFVLASVISVKSFHSPSRIDKVSITFGEHAYACPNFNESLEALKASGFTQGEAEEIAQNMCSASRPNPM